LHGHGGGNIRLGGSSHQTHKFLCDRIETGLAGSARRLDDISDVASDCPGTWDCSKRRQFSEIALIHQWCWNGANNVVACLLVKRSISPKKKSLSFRSGRQPVRRIDFERSLHGRIGNIVDPRIGVQNLIAEEFEQISMEAIGARFDCGIITAPAELPNSAE